MNSAKIWKGSPFQRFYFLFFLLSAHFSTPLKNKKWFDSCWLPSFYWFISFDRISISRRRYSNEGDRGEQCWRTGQVPIAHKYKDLQLYSFYHLCLENDDRSRIPNVYPLTSICRNLLPVHIRSILFIFCVSDLSVFFISFSWRGCVAQSTSCNHFFFFYIAALPLVKRH